MRAALARQMALAGRWRLADQIDRSHAFLFGHQYWPAVKRAVLGYGAADGVAGQPRSRGADSGDRAAGGGESLPSIAALLAGITAVGLRTLQQVGPEALAASPGETVGPGAWDGRTPEEVMAVRDKQDAQGFFGFLRGDRKQWTVVFDERYPAAQFPIINSQHLTTAAALDRRNYRARDPRCAEGPIPVQCQSCSCGTCWIGVLGGADRLVADG